jgi:hypothetical protein
MALTYPPFDAGSQPSKAFHGQQEAYKQQADHHLLCYEVALMD